ncbi:hypothetical protein CK503_10775 [Aliifodinibius salipaludis]|uniref:Protein kinase domain-containing protein n=1 Tax=Fodinibius salipaludis TaxID=2032627 RepID=A0A2A2G8Z4_9BACT|nr:serine/threonine-protein kinase [Aliifodinibius salipaludis]PAU93630.1 hypothetical protein CK503_10775 [Aliifodinibius salipaludis]
MDQRQWEKVNQIIDTALNLDLDKRSTYIKKKCQGKELLYKEVIKLLDSIEQSETEEFLEGTHGYPQNLAQDLFNSENSKSASAMIGKTVGRYEITELIGHGGMGSVYKAERADGAYDRKVAIKILRHGMDTPSNIARFKRERNILANLDHPHIAQMLDGGLTDQGLPYLVMEYVNGVPLLSYCNRHQLTVTERLQLFENVCAAVNHAHKNAIIHRDLKPSNIFVTEKGVVKVLDFGIAKLVNPSRNENIFKTRTGARILTLGYSAPEQLETQAITTATDAYVLGILLYELLVGQHPFDLEKKGLTEIEEVIRTTNPPLPSTKFKQLTEAKKEEISSNRCIKPAELYKILSGDLNAILMKALRKEQDKRYSSVEQLLEDLSRRRSDLPILARQDSFRYSASKFMKRHKTGFAVIAAFLVLILSFSAFYTWKIAKERNKAQLEAKKAREVSTFLADMFRASDPTVNPQDTVTATTFLQRGKERINQLNNQPEVKSELLHVIGRAHVNIGEYDKAQPLLEQSLDIRKNTFNSSHPMVATGLSDMAKLQKNKGNFAKAESLERKTLEIQRATLGPNSIETGKTMSALAYVIGRQGDHQAADSIYQKALKLQRANPEAGDSDIASTISDWAFSLRQLGKYEKAATLKKEALTIWRNQYGEIHPYVLEQLNDLAIVEEERGDFAKADSFYQKALSVNRQLYDEPNPNTAQLLNNIGTTNIKAGRYDKAEPYLKKSLAMRKEILRPMHPSMAESYINLGRLYIDMEKYQEALQLIQKGLKIDKEQYGDDHPYVGGDYLNMGLIAKNMASYDQAEEYFRQSLNIMQEALPEGHPSTAASMASLGETLYLKGSPKEAEPHLRKSLQMRLEAYDADDVRVAQSQVKLGICLTKLKEYTEAEEHLQNGYQKLKKKRGSSNSQTTSARKYLVQLYEQWDKKDMPDQYRQ